MVSSKPMLAHIYSAVLKAASGTGPDLQLRIVEEGYCEEPPQSYIPEVSTVMAARRCISPSPDYRHVTSRVPLKRLNNGDAVAVTQSSVVSYVPYFNVESQTFVLGLLLRTNYTRLV